MEHHSFFTISTFAINHSVTKLHCLVPLEHKYIFDLNKGKLEKVKFQKYILSVCFFPVIFGKGFGLELFLTSFETTGKLEETNTIFQVHTELALLANIDTTVGAVENQAAGKELRCKNCPLVTLTRT